MYRLIDILFEYGFLVIAFFVLLLSGVHVIVDEALSLEEVLTALLLLQELLGFTLLLLLLSQDHALLKFLDQSNYLKSK